MVTGESTKETVKTIARGMPGDSGVTVVTNACAYYQCTRGCGRIGARHSLRPLLSRAGNSEQSSGELRREIAKPCL